MILPLVLVSLVAVAQEPGGPPADPPGDEPSAEDEASSFGAALDLYGVSVSWSGYGDFVVEYEPGEALSFEATHFNPILGARLHETLWAEVEIEFEDAGKDIKLEYAFLDWTPTHAFSLRTGQFLVPIGEFNDTLHPSFRWTQVGRPAMFRDVVPAVWPDVGLQAFGEVGSGDLRFDYAAFVVNGLGGEWDPAASEPVRALRGNFEDNNMDKGVGARVRGRVRAGQADLALVASGYTGAVEPEDERRLSIADVAVNARVGSFHLLAEAATTLVEDAPARSGLYVQPSVQIGRFDPSVRWDHVQVDKEGAEPQGSVAATLAWRPRAFWSVRGEVTMPVYGAEPSPSIAGMSAFFF